MYIRMTDPTGRQQIVANGIDTANACTALDKAVRSYFDSRQTNIYHHTLSASMAGWQIQVLPGECALTN